MSRIRALKDSIQMYKDKNFFIKLENMLNIFSMHIKQSYLKIKKNNFHTHTQSILKLPKSIINQNNYSNDVQDSKWTFQGDQSRPKKSTWWKNTIILEETMAANESYLQEKALSELVYCLMDHQSLINTWKALLGVSFYSLLFSIINIVHTHKRSKVLFSNFQMWLYKGHWVIEIIWLYNT